MSYANQADQQKRIIREEQRIAKQNERARRKARGEKRVDVILSAKEAALLDEIMSELDLPTGAALRTMWRTYPPNADIAPLLTVGEGK